MVFKDTLTDPSWENFTTTLEERIYKHPSSNYSSTSRSESGELGRPCTLFSLHVITQSFVKVRSDLILRDQHHFAEHMLKINSWAGKDTGSSENYPQIQNTRCVNIRDVPCSDIDVRTRDVPCSDTDAKHVSPCSSLKPTGHRKCVGLMWLELGPHLGSVTSTRHGLENAIPQKIISPPL